MKRLFFLTLALLVAFTIMAQNDTKTVQDSCAKAEVRICGTVIDRSSHEKLNSVSVTVPNTNISTVTNADGYFVLKLKDYPEQIVTSSLGYKKMVVKLSQDRMNELHATGSTAVNISMTPVSITLPDLNVWQNDPNALICNAMDRISTNFVQKRELQTAFYRETLQKGGRYIDISEAILKMCKRGYDRGIWFDRVKVEHGRHIVSQKTKDTLSVKVQGGPMTPINYDVVKNAEMLFSDIKNNYYSFSMEIPEELDGRMQIVLSFTPRVSVDWALYSGKIYLDRQSLAFTRVEMSLDVKDAQKVVRMLLVKKPLGLRFKPQELTTVIDYREGRINYMRTFFRFKCDWKRRLFSRSYTSCSEMVVTDFIKDYDGPNIESKERFGERDVLMNTIDNFSDADFWKDYNIIEPTETLEKAINKLKKQK